MSRHALAGWLACMVVLLVGCGSSEQRLDPVAGTFRISSAVYGDDRVLALVAGEGDAPLVRLADAPPGAAEGKPVDADPEFTQLADWRFVAFAQGLYRIGSVGAADRLSIAAGYGSSPAGVELASSRRSAFQLWYVVPLADGHCRLSSALFPDSSLHISGEEGGERSTYEGRAPRLAVTSDELIGQRWRLTPIEGSEAAGLPSLCSGPDV